MSRIIYQKLRSVAMRKHYRTKPKMDGICSRLNIHLHSHRHKNVMVRSLLLIVLIAIYSAVRLLTSSLAKMRGMDYEHPISTITTIDMKSININSNANVTVSSIFRPSSFYPWYQHTSGPENAWNFKSLWSIVNRPDPEFMQQQLYAVRDGKLYGWRAHQANARTHEAYDHRLSYEQLIASSLRLAYQVVLNYSNHMELDPRLSELITQPFPFVVDWSDFLFCERRHKGSPFLAYLTFPKQMPGENCILVGMPTYAQWLKYWHVTNATYWDQIFQEQHQKYPWHSKINQTVWRGATTGEKVMYKDWRDLPRTQLVQYSLQHPDIIDAGFTRFNNRNEQEKEEIISAGLSKNFMEMADCQQYKAILDIDGNSWSSRFADLLCMNSVVVKVQPQWVDYFHPELKPWFHYIPVHKDLSDLAEVVNLVLSNDKQQQMKTIVQNANEWCKSKITGTQMTIDMMWILISYVDMLKREDINHGRLKKWKQSVSSSRGWKEQNWIEIPFNMSGRR